RRRRLRRGGRQAGRIFAQRSVRSGERCSLAVAWAKGPGAGDERSLEQAAAKDENCSQRCLRGRQRQPDRDHQAHRPLKDVDALPTEGERRQHTGGRPCGAPRSDGAPVEGAELDQPPPPESAEEPYVESAEGTHAGAMAAIRGGALTSPPAPPRTA